MIPQPFGTSRVMECNQGLTRLQVTSESQKTPQRLDIKTLGLQLKAI